MKHVFVINSHTTFLTSIGVIDYLHLENRDVIFLYTRNYKNSISQVQFKVVDCTDICNSCDSITENYKDKVKAVDDFIDSEIKGKYSLYVPHLWHWFFQLLYTNLKCLRVSYVQEGGPAQTKVYITDVPFIEQMKSFIRLAILKQRIFESKWYIKGSIYKQWTLDSYAINDVYFHCMPSKNHIVKWPKAKIDISLDAEAPIFIFDGYVKNGLVEYDVYMQACLTVIKKHAKQNNYVKFHPAQSREERNQIMDIFKSNGFCVDVMTDDIPMEYIILQFKDLTFIGFTSSLLYYAHDNGHKVICCEDEIINNSASFRNYLDECGFMTYKGSYEYDDN